LLRILFEFNSLELKLEGEKTIINNQNPSIELSIAVSNHSDTSLLCYNFFEVESVYGLSENSLCDGDGSAGMAIFIYDKNLKMKIPRTTIPDSVAYQAPDKLYRYLSESRKKFRNERIVLRTKQTSYIKKRIDLKDYELERGEYTLLLLYSSGKDILNEIDVEDLKDDEDAAKVFYGCAKSNKIKLIIN